MTLSNPAQYISGRTVQEQMNSLIDYVDQRAAEVATDAIASDVLQVHSDAADAHTDALAAAASAAAAAGTLANAVKKTGEASQSIAGDIAVTGALSGGSVSSSGNVDGASIGSGTTPVVCGDLTAYGNVSLDDTALQGNLSVVDPSALINLSGAGSVLVPTPTGNSEAATKKYVDDALDNYAPMVRTTGNQTIAGTKSFSSPVIHTSNIPLDSDGVYREAFIEYINGTNNDTVGAVKYSNGYKTSRRNDYVFNKIGADNYKATLRLEIDASGNVKLIMLKDVNGTETSTTIATM